MNIEDIKKWVLDNRKGLVVGAIVALVVRSILR